MVSAQSKMPYFIYGSEPHSQREKESKPCQQAEAEKGDRKMRRLWWNG
jgi:hypothetical protein